MTALKIVGVAAILVGLLWLAQGLSIVHWPPNSFMLDERPWALRGAVLALFGVFLIVYARRRARRR